MCMHTYQLRIGSAVWSSTTIGYSRWDVCEDNYVHSCHTCAHFVLLCLSHLSLRIACVSCPTLFNKLLEIKPSSCYVILLEFDTRFSVHGDSYFYYDYNRPLDLPESLAESLFDLVAADPPFLSEECLTKTSLTIKHLTSGKVLLCTGLFTTFQITHPHTYTCPFTCTPTRCIYNY